MIKQTQQQANDTRPLKHFTRKNYISSIACLGIQLEGFNEERLSIQQCGYYVSENPILNTLGRYVWLTKGTANVINAVAHYENDKEALEVYEANTVPLIVDDEGLEIISWKLLKQQLSRKAKARKMIRGFDEIAKNCGDNVDDWYVCKKPIPTSNLGFETEVADEFLGAVFKGMLAQGQMKEVA
jgi:hypothetical protein